MYRYFKAAVTGNSPVNRFFKLLSIYFPGEIITPEPGQFYMLQTGHTYDPLLKRPFSVFSHECSNAKDSNESSVTSNELKTKDKDLSLSSESSLQFLYRVRGKGTLGLAQMKAGDSIQVIGPMGNGYPAPEGDFIAVAGGIGIASLLPFLEKHRNRAYLFYGAQSREELVMLEKAGNAARETFITTDDGSEGRKGLITDVVKEFLNNSEKGSDKLSVISDKLKDKDSSLDSSLITHHSSLPLYACGPAPMLKALAEVVKGRGVKCYASLEEHMACGVGACLGCVVKTHSGQKRVCKEGPVFDIGEIAW